MCIRDRIQTLNAANKISWDGTGTGASQWAISSYFARVSYHYDSKYMLTMNMRADGSSKLDVYKRQGGPLPRQQPNGTHPHR